MKLYAAAITLAAAALFAPLNAVGAEPDMQHAEQSAENSGGGISPMHRFW